MRDIDEGSFDQCGPLKREMRRSYPTNPVTCEPQATTFGPWQDFLVFNNCDTNQVVIIELKVSDDRNQDGIPGNAIFLTSPDGSTHLVEDSYTICQMEKLVEAGSSSVEELSNEQNSTQRLTEGAYQLFQNTSNPLLAFNSNVVPIIDCPNDQTQAVLLQEYQEVSGELDSANLSFNAGLSSCWIEHFNPQAGAHFYETCTFSVSEEDVYIFDLYVSDPNSDVEWMGGLIQNPLGLTDGFDPDSPCRNLISQNVEAYVLGVPVLLDQSQLSLPDNEQPVWRIILPLQAGRSYSLITTTIQAGTLGNFVWRVYSDGDGVLNGDCISTVEETIEIKELICGDVDELIVNNLANNIPRCYRTDRDGNVIFPPNLQDRERVETLLARLATTGYPNADAVSAMGGSVSDDCDYLEICVSDEIIYSGDCDSLTVIRTFSVKDKQGNYIEDSLCDGPISTNSCVQNITIRKPVTLNIIWPPLRVFLDFEEGFELDVNGNPAPSVTGFPFVRTALSIHNLNQNYCNLSAFYEDSPRVGICGNSYKILRGWGFLDWCNPIIVQTYRQIIQVEDFNMLEIEGPFINETDEMLTYSTQAFDCTAAFEVPAPIIVHNSDSAVILSPSIITLVTSDVLDMNGEPTGETLTEEVVLMELDAVEIDLMNQPSSVGSVTGIPLGYHYFRYTVVDNCGNETVQDYLFFVEDQVPPVAICNEELDISLEGYPFSLYFLNDIDEGSFDQCGPIKREIRRSYPTNPNTCEPQPATFGPWQNFLVFNNCDTNQVIIIELKVSDDRNQDGIPGSTISITRPDGSAHLVQDSYTICQMEKLVEKGSFSVEELSGEQHPTQLLKTEGYQLFQNAPNPLLFKTSIGFQLPEEMMARISFYDITGKMLFLIQDHFTKGYNKIDIHKSDLRTSGVVFYMLETKDFIQTKKMIILGE